MRNLNDTIKGCKNFTYFEAINSSTAKARGIDNNIKDEKLWLNIEYLFPYIQKMRDFFGKPVIINSCYRSSALNKAVGGSSTSHHSFACACDLTVKDIDLIDVFTYFYNTKKFTELILENYRKGEQGSWVHYAIVKGRENECATKYKLVNGPVKRASFEEIMKIVK